MSKTVPEVVYNNVFQELTVKVQLSSYEEIKHHLYGGPQWDFDAYALFREAKNNPDQYRDIPYDDYLDFVAWLNNTEYNVPLGSKDLEPEDEDDLKRLIDLYGPYQYKPQST